MVPHFTKLGETENRVRGIPYGGGRLPQGRKEIWMVPAHFLQSAFGYTAK